MLTTRDPKDDLPHGPTARILRTADAEAWQNGLAYHAAALARIDRMKAGISKAHDAGRASGHREGFDKGARTATQLVAETTAAVDRYLASIEGEVARLAIDIVRRLFGEVDATELVARLATTAVAGLRHERRLQVKVNPHMVENVRQALAQVLPSVDLVTVTADPKLAPDGCIVATEFAVIDASLTAQLAAVAAGFGVALKDSGP
jgi:type III secretion protein L